MKKAAIFFIIIGAIGLSINLLFGSNTFVYQEKVRITGSLFAYKLNIWAYLQNLKDTITNTTMFNLTAITRSWDEGATDWAKLLNNLAFIVDILILLINIICFPFRLGGYMLLNMLAVFGINTIGQNAGGGLAWLVKTCKFLREMQIPYV